jgi:HAMP domain-containing protein
LRFRSKLILLVAFPLCALVAITVPGLTSRLSVVRAETRAQHLQNPAGAVTLMVQALDNENALSNWYLGSPDAKVHAELLAARAQTDRQTSSLRAEASELRAAGATTAVTRLSQLLSGLDLVGEQRRFVDLRLIPVDSVTGYYQDQVRQALRVVDAMGSSLHDATEVANLRDFGTVLRIATSAGDERAVLIAGFARGSLNPAMLQDAIGSVASQDAYQASFEAQASPALRNAFDARLRSGSAAVDRVRALRSQALAGRFTGSGATATQWYDASTQQSEQLFGAAHGVLAQTNQIGSDRKDAAKRQMFAYGAASLGVLLLALALAFAIARMTTRPLRRLTDAANDVTQNRLPRLLDAVRSGGDGEVEEATPIPVDSRDEVGELARAFNTMESTVVEVAREQGSLLRQGVSDLYVNLARRNQALIDRQIRVIDDLEADETDADRLDAMFRVDHLATRMRRNAESLLVLAGAEQIRTWGAPVAVLDLVRSAASEIADYARIDVLGLDDSVKVNGAAVVDLTHLLAELLENATSFSPPDSRVVVSGAWYESAYVVSVTDEGLGITDDRLDAANRLLAEPPPPGLALSRSLGLFVVAHLAARTGVAVQLRAGSPGTVALVGLPATVLALAKPPTVDAGMPVPAVPPATRPVPTWDERDARSIPTPPVIEPARDELVLDDTVDAHPHSRLPRRQPAAPTPEPAPSTVAPPTPPPAPAPAAAAPVPPMPPMVDVPAPEVPTTVAPAPPVAHEAPEAPRPVPYEPLAPEPVASTEPAVAFDPTRAEAADHLPVAPTGISPTTFDDFLPSGDRAAAGRPGRSARRLTRAPRAERPHRGFSVRHRRDGESDAWLEPDGWRDDTDGALSWLTPDDAPDGAGAPVTGVPSPGPTTAPVLPVPDAPWSARSEHVPPDDVARPPDAGLPAPPAPAAGGGSDDHGLDRMTPSGLPQRMPSAHTGTPPAPETAPSGPPQRAPEQVFELLARYEAGRRRGVMAAHTEPGANAEPATSHVTEDR